MDKDLKRYADNLTKRSAAESYATKYQRYWHKRMSDNRERNVLQQALKVASQSGSMHNALDMPCGAGRLTCELFPHVTEIVGCDYSLEQMKICRETYQFEQKMSFVRGNALALPFANLSFDLVLSVRLSHHIGDDKDRRSYLAELMRVCANHVIVTIFDSNSLKNRLREWRRKLYSKKRSKYTMSLDEVREVAKANDFELVANFPLARLFSGHQYLVLRRNPGQSENA